MSETYQIGTQVRIIGSFIDGDTGAAVDPTTVFFRIKLGGGVETSYEYPPAGEIVRLALGVYRVIHTIDESGTYYYRWVGTGAVVTAGESQFVAAHSHFAVP